MFDNKIKCDVFEPTHEPALSIYRALVKESQKRKKRTVHEWMEAERAAVLAAANEAALKFNYTPITDVEVLRSEIGAVGHVDYAAKWAYGIVNELERASSLNFIKKM